jgi:hypothetical protein
MLQKVENKRLKVTKHYKKPKKVDNCGTVNGKNPQNIFFTEILYKVRNLLTATCTVLYMKNSEGLQCRLG